MTVDTNHIIQPKHMVYSMTGYANRIIQLNHTSLQIDIRSVNHRFFDLSIRSPEELRPFEQLIREKISNKISRGKLDLRIYYTETDNSSLKAHLNHEALDHYLEIARQVQSKIPEATLPSISDIIQTPGILQYETLDPTTIQSLLLSELEELTDELLHSQHTEGEKLRNILLDKLNQMEVLVSQALDIIPNIKQTYREKLKHKLFESLGEAINNEQRFSQEFAYFCQKIDVDEELVRLKSHITQFRKLLNLGGAIGKKIDFLTQEMHREANTFGSKSVNLETSHQALELKVLIEQIREQIQNIA